MCVRVNYSLPVVFTQAQAGAAAAPQDDPELPIAKDVCVAYCSLAEIYLSDLWYGSMDAQCNWIFFFFGFALC